MARAIPVILLSMFKFLPSPSLAVVLGFNFWETILITVPAGIAGVTFFYLISGFLMDRSRRKRILRMAKEGYRSPRQFTSINKAMIWVKHRFGIAGIALITPAIISIPVGSIIMAKFFKHDRRALPALIVSVVFWGLVLTFLSIKFNLRFG